MSVVVLMVILGVLTYSNLIEINNQFEFLITHDLEVLQNAQKLQKLIVDTETGQRGFVIVGDEVFLESYYSGISGFKELVKVEKQLVSDNPPQVERLERIETLFEEWNQKIGIPVIELARIAHQTEDVRTESENVHTYEDLENKKNHDVSGFISKQTGKDFLDKIRGEFEIFIQIENDLKDKRFDDVKNTKKQIEFNIMIIVVIASTVGIGIAISLSHSINKSLNMLILGTKRFGKGKFEKIPIIGDDEISDLSASFNEMSTRIQHSNKRLEEIKKAIDASSIVSITDNQGVIKYVNKKFCEVSKYSEDELIGKTHRVIKSSHQSNEFWKEMWETITAGKVWSGRIKNKAKDGTYYWVQSTFIPLFDEHENIEQFIAIRNVVTKEIQFEEDLKINIEQLKEQSLELENKNLELEKIELLKDEFVAMISHELKTPLTPILMWAGALQDSKFMGKLNEKQTKATKTILNCATELSGLITDIFDSYKLDLDKIEFNEHEINLMELMENSKELAEKLIGEHSIKIENTTNEEITVYSDKKRIDQVLKNLITNAIDFVDQESGKIELNATVKGEDIQFIVKDNGIGIKKEFQDELFKKFYQINTSATRKHGGSGLGLSICQGMVNGMKGKIWVESDGNKGTIFYFTLPIVNKTKK